MFGASILLLLACGGILIQGSPISKANSKANTKILSRRNSNVNSNTNVVIGNSLPSLSPYREDDEDEEPNVSLEHVRRKLYDENDVKTASVATAAADAAQSITKTLVQEISESIAIAVAEAVAQILRRQSAGAVYSRRNYNSNVNTNIIGQDLNSVRDPQHGQGSNGLGQDFDLAHGSGGFPLGYTSDLGRISRAHGTGGPYHVREEEEEEEDEEEQEQEEEEKELTTQNRTLEVEDEKKEKEALTSKSLPGRGWGHLNAPGYRGNFNSNANNNQINFRRNLKGINNRLRDDYNEYNEYEGLKPIGVRKKSNSNSNMNVNSFRRNINSNSNNNSFRRNINSNANNRINRGSRYRRD